MQLQGKRILVTGATGSIGSQVSVTLAQRGAKLILIGRNQQKLQEVLGRLDGSEHEYIPADLQALEEIESLVSQAAQAGPLWGLVHCAGGGAITPLRVLKSSVLEQHMRVNFYSFVELVRQVTKKKHMCPEGGSIVGISSFAAGQGEQGQTAYSAAKAAMDASVRTLAYELAQRKIRINTVRPGMIESEATERYLRDMGQEKYDSLVSKQLLGLGQPRDVACMCAFLLSDCGRFITGRCLDLDGGRF